MPSVGTSTTSSSSDWILKNNKEKNNNVERWIKDFQIKATTYTYTGL